eukprot:scaffold2476_cov99-Skeletonema_marinoi.AAC.3
MVSFYHGIIARRKVISQRKKGPRRDATVGIVQYCTHLSVFNSNSNQYPASDKEACYLLAECWTASCPCHNIIYISMTDRPPTFTPRSATEQTPLVDTSSGGTTAPSASTESPSKTFSKRNLQAFQSHPTNIFFQRHVPAIQDADGVLAMKSKPKRRKNVGAFRRKRQDYASWRGRIGVHVHVDDLNLKKLVNVIYQTLSTEWELVDHYDAIRLWLPTLNLVSGGEENAPSGGQEYDGKGEIDASMPEVFLFSSGAVVFWNFPGEEAELQFMQKHLFSHEDLIGLKYNAESIDNANDEMGFCYGDVFKWHRDVVQLQTRDASEKLAVSFAVAKSANLSIYEAKLEKAIERNSHIPEHMASAGELHMTRKQVNVEIGRLFLLNNAINLETNLLDVPEDFWEDDRFEPEYKQSMKYLDVDNRIAIIDKRLAVLKDLHSILMDAANNVHASVLEWIIIILIVVEILIEVFRAYRDEM